MYLIIYTAIALSYIWYRFILLAINDFSKDKNYNYSSSVSVLITCYNEDGKDLINCVKSIQESDGDKEIVVVDDYSTNKSTIKALKQLESFVNVKIVRMPKNSGKREAQGVGIMYCNNPIIITIDSDTVIDKSSLVELIKPFSDGNVGATTGQALALNKDENFLTKMINARYWSAFNIDRKSLSNAGVITCCTGVISAYKKKFFLEHLDQYLNQQFLGQTCTYGDDRCMTNFVLKQHKVVYVEKALAYTLVPNNMKQFIKQQLRWKKSFIRESFISLRFAWKRSKLLFTEVCFNLIIPFFSLGVRLLALYLAFTNLDMAIALISGIVLMAFIHNIFLFFHDKKVAIYSIPYAFIHELILYWLYFVALFQLKNTKWGTR